MIIRPFRPTSLTRTNVLVYSLIILLGLMAAGCNASDLFAGATATPTSQPTDRQLPATPTPPPQPTQAGRVNIFLIAVEDAGKSGEEIGCGDSLVPVEVAVPATTDALSAAYEALLDIDEQFYGQSGLYNALYQSDLTLESVAVEDGRATVHLTGQLMLGGVCDNPRVEAQLRQPALQFPTVSQVSVFIDGVPLEEALFLRGDAPQQTATSPAAASRPDQEFDPGDLTSVLEWLNYAIYSNQPALVADMIGEHGLVFAPYAVGVNLPGRNNREEVLPEIEKGLQNADPVCLGYDPLFGRGPDKAIMVFQGLNFDWPAVGLAASPEDAVALQFFRYEQSWELVLVVPLSLDWELPILSNQLQPCPGG